MVPPVDPATSITDSISSTLEGVQSAKTTTEEKTVVDDQIKEFVNQASISDVDDVKSPADASSEPESTSSNPAAPASPSVDAPVNVNGKKVLQPLSDPTAKPDLNKLLEEEEKKQAVSETTQNTTVEPQMTPPPVDPNLIAL